MFDIIASVVLLLLEFFSFKIFMDTFLEKRDNGHKWLSTLLMIATIGVSYVVAHIVQPHFILKFLIILILYTVVWYCYYNTSVVSSMLLFIVCYAILSIGQYITMLVIYLIVPDVMQTVDDNEYISYLFGYLMTFISTFIVICIHLKFKNKESKLAVSRKYLMYMILPLYTIFTIGVIISNWSIIQNQRQFYAIMSIIIGLVIVNILTFYLIGYSLRQQMTEYETKLIQEQLEYEWKAYKSQEENYKEQRKRAHEYNSQLSHIGAMLANKQYEDVQKYFEEIKVFWGGQLQIVDANHPIINTILNSKINEAMQGNIACSVNVNDLSGCSVEHQDLVLLLSNMFNNAIEACLKCDNRKIDFEMLKNDRELKIKLSNTMKQKPVEKKGIFVTSKKDKSIHGIGISNIKDTVKKYSGECCISYKDNQFVILILIPLH